MESLIKEAEGIMRLVGNKVILPNEWEKTPSSLTYMGQNELDFTHRSLHNGQRKLFNSLLLFLVKYHSESKNVVYIGAAPGYNIVGVARLFPTHIFYLYDMKEIRDLEKLPNIEIQKPQAVTVDTEFPVSQDDCIFFSDIRGDNYDKERSVEKDQELQLQIVERLRPKAFCLKFRIPFYDRQLKKTESYQYLAGTLYIQPYAPQQTNEVRLMSSFTTDRKEYELRVHENKMFYINTITREWQKFKVEPGVNGSDECYDCAIEQSICNAFMQRFESPVQFITDVVSLRNYISSCHGTLKLREHNVFGVKRLPSLSMKKVDLLSVVSKIYHKWIKFQQPITDSDIKAWLSGRNPQQSERWLTQTFTHSSINEHENYEQLEFLGDGILNSETKFHIWNWYDASKVHPYSTLYNYLASSTYRADIIEKRLDICKYLNIEHHGLITNKVKDDLVEAFVGVTRVLFDINIGVGYGLIIASKLITALLETENLENYADKVLPKKTILKETLDHYYHDAGGFSTLYKMTRDQDTNKIDITIQIVNKELGKNEIIVERSTTDLSQAEAEDKASEMALKMLDALGEYRPQRVLYHRRQQAKVKPKEPSLAPCLVCSLRSSHQ